MKKKWLFLLVVLLGSVVALVLASRPSIPRSVSVTFLCYTNCDTLGWNDQYRWAWFRIENRSPFSLSCQQGPKDVERAGAWESDTDRVGFQYGWIIEPGKGMTVSMMPPADATRWRTSFQLTKMDVPSVRSSERQARFARFMDGLHLERIGYHKRPWKDKTAEPVVVTSQTIGL